MIVEFMNTSYEITAATKQIFSKNGYLGGVLVMTGGAADAVVIAYDMATGGTPAAGNKIYETTVKAADHYGGVIFPYPLKLHHGLYFTVSGADASYIAYYRSRA